ncbi:hypothetical protein Athai_04050 [Actinocatenispora thailandica]|uniref:Uncharacterized protein n=1 Tax=Actinocatenispora thailandica TaxID=227318 RepID=A0A7R7HUG6_9ACTN|nr:hypothetical protein [Actinocatenispora thailandica]BCJ32902.1 hypothetical protein Athai_04050 [Actinocatenispora thailandica]
MAPRVRHPGRHVDLGARGPPHSRIERIEVARPTRLLGPPARYTIWIVPTHGRTVETPIQRDDRWRLLRPRGNAAVVSVDEFAETVATLRGYLARPGTRPVSR